jgi:hypothetical protein
MAQWCKGYLLLRRVSKGVGTFCTSVLVVLYVLCCVLCCAGRLLAKHPFLYSISIEVLIRVDFAGIRGQVFDSRTNSVLIIGAGGDKQRTPYNPAEDKTPHYGR